MYLKRLIGICLFSLAACYVTGVYFDHRYRKNFAILFFNSTDTLLDHSKNYDIILLGNSRIHFGLNPYYIDSVTGSSSYNFAIGGSDAAMLSLNTSLYLDNHPAPAYAVIGSDISFLVDSRSIQSQYHYLFYLGNDTVFKTMRHYNPSLLLAKYLPFLKYSFFDEYNRRHIFKTKVEFETFDHNIYKGFINPHRGDSTEPQVNFLNEDKAVTFSQASINMVKEIVRRLENAGTKVIIISPPLKATSSAEKKKMFNDADVIFRSIAKENGAIFIDADEGMFYDNKYFTDDLHLSEPGTRIFSRQVGSILLTEIESKLPDTKRTP